MPPPGSSTRKLAQMVQSAPMPIYALDDRRRIVYCNPACAAWVGVKAGDLVGLRCDYHSPGQCSGLEAAAAALCPPPEAFLGRRCGGVIFCPAAGRLVRRRAEFLPLGPDPAECVGVLVMLDSVDLDTEQPPSEQESRDEAARLHEKLQLFRRQQTCRFQLDRLIGHGPAMRRVRAQVELALGSFSPVLIVGPAGSGREHVARTIHFSGRGGSVQPLVPLAAPLMDAELLQATITALVRQQSRKETDAPAALLLLEADRLPADAQMELAGFFDLPGFELRVLATARTPLLDLVEPEGYRRDLAHALSALVIEIPPLADHADDVPLLAQLLLEEENAQGGRQLGGFTSEALDALAGYPWPGNIDELADMVRQIHRRTEGPLVAPADLPPQIYLAADAAVHPRRAEEKIVLDEVLAEVETELIRRALVRAKGNKTKAARLLGITRARLHRRLTQLGLNDQ